MEREMSRRIGAAGAVLQSLYRIVVTKRELSQKAKLSVFRAIFVPTLTYGHDGWVMLYIKTSKSLQLVMTLYQASNQKTHSKMYSLGDKGTQNW